MFCVRRKLFVFKVFGCILENELKNVLLRLAQVQKITNFSLFLG